MRQHSNVKRDFIDSIHGRYFVTKVRAIILNLPIHLLFNK